VGGTGGGSKGLRPVKKKKKKKVGGAQLVVKEIQGGRECWGACSCYVIGNREGDQGSVSLGTVLHWCKNGECLNPEEGGGMNQTRGADRKNRYTRRERIPDKGERHKAPSRGPTVKSQRKGRKWCGWTGDRPTAPETRFGKPKVTVRSALCGTRVRGAGVKERKSETTEELKIRIYGKKPGQHQGATLWFNLSTLEGGGTKKEAREDVSR